MLLRSFAVKKALIGYPGPSEVQPSTVSSGSCLVLRSLIWTCFFFIRTRTCSRTWTDETVLFLFRGLLKPKIFNSTSTRPPESSPSTPRPKPRSSSAEFCRLTQENYFFISFFHRPASERVPSARPGSAGL